MYKYIICINIYILSVYIYVYIYIHDTCDMTRYSEVHIIHQFTQIHHNKVVRVWYLPTYISNMQQLRVCHHQLRFAHLVNMAAGCSYELILTAIGFQEKELCRTCQEPVAKSQKIGLILISLVVLWQIWYPVICRKQEEHIFRNSWWMWSPRMYNCVILEKFK